MSFIYSPGGLSNPMTTRGDLIRGGVSGAVERVAAVTNGTVVSGNGTDVVSQSIATTLAVAPTDNLAALYTTTTPQLTSSSGWTVVDGGTAVGTVASGAFTVAIESTGSGAVADTSGATRAAPPTGRSFEFVFSASIDTAGAGTVYGGARLVFGATTLLVFLADQGTVGVDDGSYTAVIASQPIDGTLWIRGVVNNNQLTIWTAIGTTTVAPVGMWFLRSTITMSALTATPSTVALFGTHNSGGALGADVIVAVRNFSITPR